MGMDIQMVEDPDPEAHPGIDGYYRFRTPAMRAMAAAMERAGVFAGGTVDPEWFRWNDGQLVAPEACRHIANTLSAFAARIVEADVAHVDAAWSAAEAELMGRLGAQVTILKPASANVKMTRQELIDFVADWANYNRVAAEHGGYRVS
jgi:hypothetical protein